MLKLPTCDFLSIETPQRARMISEFWAKCHDVVRRCRLSERQFVSRACRLYRHQNKTGKREHRDGPLRSPLSGGSRFHARSHDTRRPRGWGGSPSPREWVAKALCPPKVAPGLQSTGSPRIPGELSGAGGESWREGRNGRVTALLPGGKKSRQGCGDTFARDPSRVDDKATQGEKRVSLGIFFGRDIIYIILGRLTRAGDAR